MNLIFLSLQHFRSYNHKNFNFDKNLTIIIGPNAAGKTNILEAIYLLATGESFRAGKIDEMITFDQVVGRVSGRVRVSQSEDIDLEVVLTTGLVSGQKVPKRKYLVNDIARRKNTFNDYLSATIFLPEHLRLISGSPSLRREYLNSILSQVDKNYYRSLVSYNKALRRRNKLLDLIREGQTKASSLTFWDNLVIKNGNVLTTKRREFIDYLNINSSNGLTVRYDHSAISEARLKQYEREEIAAGFTLVGPHKDDFQVFESDKDLAAYGSRGEQRMAILWLKGQELDYFESQTQTRPVLILDDIFSELDGAHRQEVWSWCTKQQTIITTTDARDIKDTTHAQIITLK